MGLFAQDWTGYVHGEQRTCLQRAAEGSDATSDPRLCRGTHSRDCGSCSLLQGHGDARREPRREQICSSTESGTWLWASFGARVESGAALNSLWGQGEPERNRGLRSGERGCSVLSSTAEGGRDVVQRLEGLPAV